MIGAGHRKVGSESKIRAHFPSLGLAGGFLVTCPHIHGRREAVRLNLAAPRKPVILGKAPRLAAMAMREICARPEGFAVGINSWD